MRVRAYCCFNNKIFGSAAGLASVLDRKGESRATGQGTKIKTRCRFDMVINVLPHVRVM